jgi:hypothetical protein
LNVLKLVKYEVLQSGKDVVRLGRTRNVYRNMIRNVSNNKLSTYYIYYINFHLSFMFNNGFFITTGNMQYMIGMKL